MEAATPEAYPELASTLETLHQNAPKWLELGPREIIELLNEVRDGVLAVADEWVELASEAKGLAKDSPLRGEEWAGGPWATMASINGLVATLGRIADGKDPLGGMQVRARPDGQVLVDVFPATPWDSLLLSGYTATVWQKPGVTKDNLRETIGVRFREGGTPAPRVGLVLGAGNIASIPPLDALHELVHEGKTCLVKMNPVNDNICDVLNRAFAPLVDRGFLKYVKGDGAVGAWLTTHALVDTIHITGSARTHDVIVFGGGDDGAARKQRNEPRLTKPISSELGGVGGTIVVPGPWTAADIRFQAEHLVTQKLYNDGFACVASQVIVLPREWSGTQPLIDEVRKVIDEVVDNRPPYYPGTADRLAVLKDAHPDAHVTGDVNPFVMVEGLSADSDDVSFNFEAFAPFFAVATIDETDPDKFLAAAVDFANDKLMGTLSCQLMIHPRTERQHKAALEQAIADLRFGAIGVNAWSGIAFLLPHATWGAFPGHTLDDVQSGIGVVHNASMFDQPQKTVVRAPFQEFPRTLWRGQIHTSPKPFWYVTHPRAEQVGRYMTKFEGTHDVTLLAPLFANALRG